MGNSHPAPAILECNCSGMPWKTSKSGPNSVLDSCGHGVSPNFLKLDRLGRWNLLFPSPKDLLLGIVKAYNPLNNYSIFISISQDFRHRKPQRHGKAFSPWGPRYMPTREDFSRRRSQIAQANHTLAIGHEKRNSLAVAAVSNCTQRYQRHQCWEL